MSQKVFGFIPVEPPSIEAIRKKRRELDRAWVMWENAHRSPARGRGISGSAWEKTNDMVDKLIREKDRMIAARLDAGLPVPWYWR